MKTSQLKQIVKEEYQKLLKEEDAEQILYHLDLKDVQEKEITDKRAIYTTTSDPEYVKNQLQSSLSKYITGPEWKHYYKSYNVLSAGEGLTQIVFHKFPPGEMSDVDFDREQNVQAQYRDEVNENKTTMKRSELKEIIKEIYLKTVKEEDKGEDDVDEFDADFDEEPAEPQGGESRAQEEAPRKRINFENRELEMLVDVNRNPTKRGVKIQFLSDDELSKEERTKLVSALQVYLDEGLAEFVKGPKLNVDSDPDVPNKTKTVGFTIKIGDIFGLVSSVFSNRGDDEEEGEGEEGFEAETEEAPEELNENISNVRKYLYDYARTLDSEGKLKLAKELAIQAQELRSMAARG
jgi:hypothetical protein